jgi:hypothetical protein
MSQSPSSEGTKIGVPALVDGSPGEARRGREGQEQGGGGKGGDSEGEGEGEPKGEPEPEPGGRLEGGKGPVRRPSFGARLAMVGDFDRQHPAGADSHLDRRVHLGPLCATARRSALGLLGSRPPLEPSSSPGWPVGGTSAQTVALIRIV